MKQFFSFILLLLAAVAAPQRSVAQGSFVVDDITVIPGATTTIEVKYAANGSETQCLEFNVELPTGLSYVKGSEMFGPTVPEYFKFGEVSTFRNETCIFFSIINTEKLYVPDGATLTFDVRCDENIDWEENSIKVFGPFVGIDMADFDAPVHRGTAFTLEDGMFLRIKADDSHYLCMPEDTENDITFDGTGTEKGSIFYWDGSTLLAYNNGHYVTQSRKSLIPSDSADDNVAFTMKQEGNKFVVSYKSGANTYYVVVEDDELGYTSIASNATPLTFEALETLPVTTNANGYVTLYSPVALTVPKGVKAYTASYNDSHSAVKLTETSVVFAACGVVIEAEDFAAHTFDFPLSEEKSEPVGVLTGSYATIEAVKGAYTLQKVNDVIGFYPFMGENLTGFKAYLTEAAAQSIQMIKEEPSTGIIESVTDAQKAAPIYDLQGRRIMTKAHDHGLYITNGKKIVK